MHRSWNVCHPSTKEDGDRERLPRCSKQSHQGVPEVQCNAQVHGLQLSSIFGLLAFHNFSFSRTIPSEYDIV